MTMEQQGISQPGNITVEEVAQLLGASQITIYLLNKQIIELNKEIQLLKEKK